MVSIIISSYQDNYYSALQKNIADTIGIVYEMIRIHNPGTMGICEAYNRGASKAQYDNLLFIHEDIIFRTQDWGAKLISHLQCEGTGVFGLAGSNYVPTAPSAWSVPSEKYKFANVNSKIPALEKNTSPTLVYALDGVFLAVKKMVYDEFRFDEKLEGFHGYDTDFSLRVATKYKNFVIWDIFIKHFSKGKPDEQYLINNMQIRKKTDYRFHPNYDAVLEDITFHNFLRDYFRYNKVSLKGIRSTLPFIPTKVSFKMKLIVLRSYLYYIVKNF